MPYKALVIVPITLCIACGTGPQVGPACEAYLACAADAGIGDQAMLSYGEESACWESDETAATCETSCASALSASEAAYPLVQSCDGGDGLSATEAFAVASSWAYEDEDLEATSPCDDIISGESEGEWDMDPGAGADFAMDGYLTTVAMRYAWDANCTLEWGGFSCDPVDGGYGSVISISGSFSPDMLTSTATVLIETTDQDRETGEDVPCSYTLTMWGTVSG